MIKKEAKLNMKKVKWCIVIVLIFVLLIAISMYIKLNKIKKQHKEITVLFNNKFIELSDKPIVDEEKNIFFSKDDIQEIFDKTIYYNQAEKELITTYNKHVALLKVDEEYAEINDETIKLKGKLQEVGNEIYIPITDLSVVYDLDIKFSVNNNRIIMDSTQNKKIEASVIKRTKIKKSKGIFGKKIDNAIIGDKVVILETDGKYKKVRTPLGNIGYIKENKLSDETIIREDYIQNKKELNIYRNYSNISGIYDNIQVDDKKLNVVLPSFFYLENDSKVLDKTTSTTATYAIYKNWVDTNKLQILPIFTNNATVSANLLSYSQRSKVINELKNDLIKYGYIGINIEFESINDLNSFYRFILELTPRFKESGLIVAVTLNNNLEKSRIQNVVDYIIED